MDAEQLKLLTMAAQETDPDKLVELVEEILRRFEAHDDPHQLCAAVAARRAS